MTRNHIGVDLSKDALDVCDPRRGAARVANEPEADRRLGRRPRARRLRRLRGDERLRPARCAWRSTRPGSPAGAAQSAARLALRPLAQPRQDRPARRGDPRPPRAPSASPRRTRPSTPPARSCARSSSAATSSSAWKCRRRTASPRCPAPAGRGRHPRRARQPRRPLARIETAIAAHARPPPDARGRRPAAALDPGHRPGHRHDPARLSRPSSAALDRRAVASLAGLAPRAHDSGRYRGKRFLGDGRRQVRRALYMAATSTCATPASSRTSSRG